MQSVTKTKFKQKEIHMNTFCDVQTDDSTWTCGLILTALALPPTCMHRSWNHDQLKSSSVDLRNRTVMYTDVGPEQTAPQVVNNKKIIIKELTTTGNILHFNHFPFTQTQWTVSSKLLAHTKKHDLSKRTRFCAALSHLKISCNSEATASLWENYI